MEDMLVKVRNLRNKIDEKDLNDFEVQKYILKEIQKSYRTAAAVEISDKHVEIIVKQMLQKAIVVHEGDEVRILDRGGAGSLELGNDLGVNAQRQSQTALGGVHDVKALLSTGRGIRERNVAGGVHDAQNGQAVADEGLSLGEGNGHALDFALGSGLNSVSSAVGVGDHLQIDAGRVHQVAAGDVPDRTGRGTAHHDLARMSLGVLDESSQIGDVVGSSPLGVDGDGGGVDVDAAQRIIVLIGVIGHLLSQVGGELEGHHAHGVAVRIGISDGLVADNAAGAGEVVNGQGLAELLFKRQAERTQAGVGAAAGAPGADHGDALGRILGRGRDGRQAHNQHERDDESEKLLHRIFLLKNMMPIRAYKDTQP